MYSHLFVSKYGIEDSGVWFETLKDLTPRALDNGIEILRSGEAGDAFCEYPPNPMQFRKLCLAFYAEVRLPSVADAYNEIKRRAYTTSPHWSHLAVKFTANKLSENFLAIDDERAAYTLFKKTYAKVCHLARMGLEIPDIREPMLLGKPASRESALAHLKQLKQHLGV